MVAAAISASTASIRRGMRIKIVERFVSHPGIQAKVPAKVIGCTPEARTVRPETEDLEQIPRFFVAAFSAAKTALRSQNTFPFVWLSEPRLRAMKCPGGSARKSASLKPNARNHSIARSSA